MVSGRVSVSVVSVAVFALVFSLLVFAISPTVTLNSPSNNSYSSSSTVVFNCSTSSAAPNDTISNVSLYTNITGAWQSNSTNGSALFPDNSYNFTIENVPDGNIHWNCYSVNNGSIQNFSIGNYSVTVDTSVPPLTLVAPAEESTGVLNANFSNSILINFSAGTSNTSLATAQYRLDNGTFSTAYANISAVLAGGYYNATLTASSFTGLTEGIFNLTINITDLAGNSNATTYQNLRYDRDPFIIITTPSILTNANVTTATIVGTATDAFRINATVINDTRFNNTGNETHFTFVNISALNDSDYQFLITANDSIGTTNTSYVNFTLDRTPPSEIVTNVNAIDSDLDGNIELSWSANDSESAVTYRIYRDTTEINSSNLGSLLFTTPEGVTSFEDNSTSNATTYYYSIVMIDSAGNVNTSARSRNDSGFANDTLAPAAVGNLTVSSVNGTTTLVWNRTTRDIAGNADLGITYRIYLDEKADVNFSNRFNSSYLVDLMTLEKTVSCTAVTCTTTISDDDADTDYSYFITTRDDAEKENQSFIGSSSLTNWANNTQTEDEDDDSSSSSSGSSGSSSSSGGGGGTTTTAGIKYSRFWNELAAGETVVEVSRDGIPISEISFELGVLATNVNFAVTALEAKPSSISTPSFKVFQYIDVTTSGISSSNINEAAFKFEVEKKWLSDQGATKDDVTLYRYRNSRWNTLATRQTGSSTLNYNYEADSPGFSTFAIGVDVDDEPEETEDAPVAAQAAAEGDGDEEETPEEETLIEEDSSGGFSVGMVLIIVIVIVILLLIGALGFMVQRGYISISKKEEDIDYTPEPEPDEPKSKSTEPEPHEDNEQWQYSPGKGWQYGKKKSKRK